MVIRSHNVARTLTIFLIVILLVGTTPIKVTESSEKHAVTIIDDQPAMHIYKRLNLSAQINSKYADTKVVWTSSNDNIASVTKYGVVYAKKTGNVVITATAEDGSKDSVSILVVSRSGIVDNQKDLERLLKSDAITCIAVRQRERAKRFVVQEGDYSDKLIYINAGKSSFVNSGTFKKMYLVDLDLYTEKGVDNVISVRAKDIKIRVEKEAKVRNLQVPTGNEKVNLVVEGEVTLFTLGSESSHISMTGDGLVVTTYISPNGKDVTINTKLKTNFKLKNNAIIEIEKGAEDSQVTYLLDSVIAKVIDKTKEAIKEEVIEETVDETISPDIEEPLELYTVYARPDETIPASREYQVFVGDEEIQSFVYYSEPPKYDPDDPKSNFGKKKDGADYYRENGITQNWTTFSTTKSTKVRVKKETPFTSVSILPSQYEIEAVVNEDHTEVSFYIEPTQKVFVEFDGQLIDRLYIFADPMEDKTYVPDKEDPRVFVAGSATAGTPIYGENPGCLDGLTEEHTTIYFPAGVYDIESYGKMIEKPEDNNGFVTEARVGYRMAWILPEHITQIYIEGGAVVEGGFHIYHDNVRINGRGVISGRSLVYHQMNLLEYAAGTKGGYVEGITLSDGVHFSLRGWAAQYSGENFKVIANWRYNNDGINVPENAVIKNCYISGNDDTIKFYFGGSTLENCVIGQMINGAVFQFGWGYRHVSNINVKDVYILHYDGTSKNSNIGVINFRPRGVKDGYPAPDENGVIQEYKAHNITFDGLYMDNPIPRLVSLGLPEYQTFDQLIIRNVEMEKFSAPSTAKNYIKGSTDASAIGEGLAENIILENIKIGNSYMDEYNYTSLGNFEPFNPEIVKNVQFIVPELPTSFITECKVCEYDHGFRASTKVLPTSNHDGIEYIVVQLLEDGKPVNSMVYKHDILNLISFDALFNYERKESSTYSACCFVTDFIEEQSSYGNILSEENELLTTQSTIEESYATDNMDTNTNFVMNGDFEKGDSAGVGFESKFPSWDKIREDVIGTISLRAEADQSNKWVVFRKNQDSTNIMSQTITSLSEGIYTLGIKTAGDGCSSAFLRVFTKQEDGSETLLKEVNLPNNPSSDFQLSEISKFALSEPMVTIQIEVNALANKTFKVDDITLIKVSSEPEIDDDVQIISEIIAGTKIWSTTSISGIDKENQVVEILLKEDGKVIQSFEIIDNLLENQTYEVYFGINYNESSEYTIEASVRS